jgi:rRNA maturation protein Nop10
MTRLIDADALKEYFKTIRKYHVGKYSEWYLADVLEQQPTVDAVPVRHGKWIIRDNPGTGWYRVTCSECGEDVTSTAPCIGFFPNAKVTWDYCPSCGARMDADETD